MQHIGCHLSAGGGYLAMGKEALSLGADTFQFFTRNPRGGSARPMDAEDAAALLALTQEHGFAPLVAHAPYTMNPCAADEGIREFAFRTISDDLDRLEHLPGSYYNLHPGCHVGQGKEEGIRLLAQLLNRVLHGTGSTVVLLETMAGKGSEIGSCFEELKEVLDRAEDKEHLGVCLDTCHVNDAGYDLVSDLDGVLDEFDRVIGLEKLRALHLNDSMNPLGSHKDRHQKIGEGYLGTETFRKIVNHPRLAGLPMLLETPNDLAGYAREIALLHGLEDKNR